jgi:hypothetical protein
VTKPKPSGHENENDPPSQLTYVVTRYGERAMRFLREMTDAELLERAEACRAQARGLQNEAEDLDRYVTTRRKQK